MTTRVGLFLCPSDPAQSPPGYGRVNYRFSIGPTAWEGNSIAQPETWAGAFAVLHAFEPSDFSDGLSATIGASERIQGSWLKNHVGLSDYLVPTNAGGLQGPLFGPDRAVAVCANMPPMPPTETRSGESWFLSGLHFTQYNHCATPNWARPDCGFFPFDEEQAIGWRAIQNGVFTARSHHAGGVQVLMMGGSLHFVKESVNLAVWRALSTRAQGEVVTGFGG
jgi:hypothetical protein